MDGYPQSLFLEGFGIRDSKESTKITWHTCVENPGQYMNLKEIGCLGSERLDYPMYLFQGGEIHIPGKNKDCFLKNQYFQ